MPALLTGGRVLFVDLYFVVKWEDEEDMLDVLSQKMVIPPKDVDITNLNDGDSCCALFNGTSYNALVVARGTY